MEIFKDTSFVTALAFFIFIAAMYIWFRGPIGSAFKSRPEAIRAELKNAEDLRDQAQAALAEIQRQQRDAQAQAKDIVANAKAEVENFKTAAQAKLEESIKRREAQAADKIAQAEAAALQEVRNLAVDLAMAATTQVLTEKLSGKDGDKVVDAAIADLSGKLH